MALNNNKAEGKNSNIKTKGSIDAQLAELINNAKAKTMSLQKDQLKNNKIAQDNNKANLEKQKETYNALSPETT